MIQVWWAVSAQFAGYSNVSFGRCAVPNWHQLGYLVFATESVMAVLVTVGDFKLTHMPLDRTWQFAHEFYIHKFKQTSDDYALCVVNQDCCADGFGKTATQQTLALCNTRLNVRKARWTGYSWQAAD